MSKRRGTPGFKLVAIVLVLGVASLGSQPATTQTGGLPNGKSAELVQMKCLLCHEADLIIEQRLSRSGWVREVDKMIRWGAEVSDADKESVIDYLAANFGNKRLTPADSEISRRGAEILEAKCLICHESDLIKQQRLSPAGWTRELDKMIRWGADLSNDEKKTLVIYLAEKFSP